MAAKKKVKKAAAKRTAVKSRATGDLFKDHPNLVWLLPVLFIAFAIVLLAQNSSY